MADVMQLAGRCVVLLDELVMFPRQLTDERFEAFLSFIQSLTKAAAVVPHALIIGLLPESDAEARGARGKEALLRLEKVSGRVQSPWLPASGDETCETIRRRPQGQSVSLPGQAAGAQDGTVQLPAAALEDAVRGQLRSPAL